MNRPPVSVVMPFAGTSDEAAAAVAALRALDAGPEDELILADNQGVAAELAGVQVVPVPGERSPAHARNVGAEQARNAWVLFLDADCEPEPGLLSAYFATPVADDVGARAGEVVAEIDAGDPVAARYGAARGFLGLGVHLAHPYLPRAAAANLLVRRAAFQATGGFHEGVRAAEDTDFSWRLQRAGWRLEPCPAARARHRYRTSVGALRRQWRGYAAGRAWLGRRYEDFTPEPALRRVVRRRLGRRGIGRRVVPAGSPAPGPPGPPGVRRSGPAPGSGLTRRDRSAFLVLDALLGIEELAGLALSNRPGGCRSERRRVEVVLVADRFPERGDPLADYARSLGAARVEASARPEHADGATARALRVDYREDDGAAARWAAVFSLVVHRPVRVAHDRFTRGDAEPSLAALAPAVARLRADRGARVRALGGAGAGVVARRLATLAGRPVEGGQ